MVMHASHPTPQYRRILVPTDGSPGTRNAAEAAAQLALVSGGCLIVLHVQGPDSPGTADPRGEAAPLLPLEAVTLPTPEVDAATALDAVAAIAQCYGIEVETESVIDDKPARAIAEAAESHDCDLIVLASRGYGPLLSALTASGASSLVVAECAVPVLVVR
jgi:nucleotide-binding universal stress UspA family protein